MHMNIKNIANKIFSTIFAIAMFLCVSLNMTVSVKAENITSRQPQDVSNVIDATMSKLADTVKEPAFGTIAGEWTVLCLSRGEHFEKDNAYYLDYYDRIVEYVNTKAASIDMNGALHKSKSTDNSRVILALSSIGRDATAVGNWNLTTPYEDFKWIKKQGINGAIFALIALDTRNYQTTDETIRQQCIDFILGRQLADGGWALSGNVSDPDVTAMALQSLYPYKDSPEVLSAAEIALTCLSNMQNEDGGFASWGTVNSESCAQVIVALTTWGINPDTDSRFIKNDKSVIDNILTYFAENDAMFKHVITGQGDAMATDQACYALIAYDRFLKGKTSLYDMSDTKIQVDDNNESGNKSDNENLNSNITDTSRIPDNTIQELPKKDAENTEKNEKILIPQTGEKSYFVYYSAVFIASVFVLIYSLRILKKG